MRKDKDYILKLRQDGKTYRQIQKETGVSRGTLGNWFKDLPWSKHLSVDHRGKLKGAAKETITRMNMVRKLSTQYKYALVESEAAKEYETYKRESLFWAGLMIYAGEGDKRSQGLLRVTNAEFYVHRIFTEFLKRYLRVEAESVRYALLLHPGLDETICKNVWMKQLSVKPISFHKTQVIQGREKRKRLQYGVGVSIISNTVLKKKVLKWLVLAQEERFSPDAVIV